MPQQVHASFVLSQNHALCEVTGEVKKGSSKWIKTQGGPFGAFLRQNGYGALPVSQSHVTRMRRYIEHQTEHHRGMSFQKKSRLTLKRHGIEYDERYVWD